jgi:hypothetical protein
VPPQINWCIPLKANFSKAAWGEEQLCSADSQKQLKIRSYEAGVLMVGGGADGAGVGAGAGTIVSQQHPVAGAMTIPVPYDLPLTKYQPGQRMWIWDLKAGYPEPDSNGCMIGPR